MHDIYTGSQQSKQMEDPGYIQCVLVEELYLARHGEELTTTRNILAEMDEVYKEDLNEAGLIHHV